MISELLKNAEKKPLTQQEIINLGQFMRMNASKIEYYNVNDWNGDSFVIMKWPHKVPELKIIP
jgi:hypothetical protein